MSKGSSETLARLGALHRFSVIEQERMSVFLDALRSLDPVAAEHLEEAALLVMNVPPGASVRNRERVLETLTLAIFLRVFRLNASPRLAQLVPALTADLPSILAAAEALIASAGPPAFPLGRLALVSPKALQLRAANPHPDLLAPLASFAHTSRFTADPQPLAALLDPTTSSQALRPEHRAAIAHVAADLLAVEAADRPAREVRAAIVAAASLSPALTAARTLLATTAAAPVPLERARDATTLAWDAGTSTLVVTSPHPLTCLCSLICRAVRLDLSDPLAPTFSPSHTSTAPAHCTLRRLTAELLTELLAGLDPTALSASDRDALRVHCFTPPGARLIRRIDAITRTLSDENTKQIHEIAWIYEPSSGLYLAEIAPLKRGGHKRVRLDSHAALSALTRPEEHAAAFLLRMGGLFQTSRAKGASAPEVVAAALATLGPTTRLFVLASTSGAITPVRLERHEPTLLFARNAAGEAVPTLALGGHPLDAFPTRDRAWVLQVDLAEGVVRVGALSESLKAAAQHLEHMRATPITETELPSLAQALARLGEQVSVTPDRAWLGAEVARAPVWVLQLGWGERADAHRGLSVALRVRVSEFTAAYVPGEGTPTLPVQVRGEDGTTRIGHVQRDLRDELAQALELMSHLGLSEATSEGLATWFLDSLEAVTAFMHAAEEAQRDSLVEVHWSTQKPVIQKIYKFEDIQIDVGMRRDWLDIKGGVARDGSELPLSDLLKALAEKKRFVVLDGERLVELTDALVEGLGPLASLARPHGGGLTLSPLAAPLLADLAERGASVTGSPAWSERYAALSASQHLTPVTPPELAATLRPYQIEGFSWLARLAAWAPGACLADDMGLGKTLQALTLILSRADRGPSLVVAPTSVLGNWRREARRFTPTLEVCLAGSGASLDEALEGLGPRVLIVTSWDLLVRHPRLHRATDEQPWVTAVLDEAHAVKNAATRRAQAARALSADFVVALTGTPVENRASELWSLMSVVAPGLLGSLEFFRDRFARPIEQRVPGASEALTRLIRPFILRRTKGVVAPELPPRTEVEVDVILTPGEQARYQRLRRSAIAALEEAQGGDSGQTALIRMLAVLTRLRQLACHPRLVDPKAPAGSSKLTRLLELVTDLQAEGRKVLIFSQFTELLALVAEALSAAGVTFVQLEGKTPAVARAAAIDRFQAGEVDAFLLSLKAGGVGLNLTTATEVIHLDPWWNPAAEDQASDRAHRIGQEAPVTIYKMIARQTIEEQILKLHAEKRALVQDLLDGTGRAVTVTPEDLLALLIDEGDPADTEPPDPDDETSEAPEDL